MKLTQLFAFVFCVLLFSCTRTVSEQSAIDIVKKDKDFINYMQKSTALLESFMKDEWKLSDSTVAANWKKAKQEKRLREFKKQLINSRGVSLYTMELNSLATYSQVYYKFVKQRNFTREILSRAQKEYLSSYKHPFDVRKLPLAVKRSEF